MTGQPMSLATASGRTQLKEAGATRIRRLPVELGQLPDIET
ncbi:hypothetical protein ACLQ2D_29000 [Streptomyces sp. DT199]|nr:hypothetical protein [Streptomyces sp. NRRL S-146]